MNGLKRLYTGKEFPVRAQIQLDLKKRGISHQRLSHWINKEDADFLEMPVILKQIVCDNIPEAEALFKLPQIKPESIV